MVSDWYKGSIEELVGSWQLRNWQEVPSFALFGVCPQPETPVLLPPTHSPCGLQASQNPVWQTSHLLQGQFRYPSLLEALLLPQRISPRRCPLQTVHKQLQGGSVTQLLSLPGGEGPRGRAVDGLCDSSQHNAQPGTQGRIS